MSRLGRFVVIALLLSPLVLPAVPMVHAGGKGTQFAFLVGCGKYAPTEFKALPYAGNDVLGFREALLATGFHSDEIVVLHDGADRRYLPHKDKILKELAFLLDTAGPEDTLVVALSGHGLQYKGDPVGYFVPVDGKVSDKGSLIPLTGQGGLYEQLNACKARKKLVVVNACRNDPVASLDFLLLKADIVDQGRDDVPAGIAVIYSCSPGEKSYWDPTRKRALFFEQMIRSWKGEYAPAGKNTLSDVLRQTVVKTKLDANKMLDVRQTPYVMNGDRDDWIIPTAGARPR